MYDESVAFTGATALAASPAFGTLWWLPALLAGSMVGGAILARVGGSVIRRRRAAQASR